MSFNVALTDFRTLLRSNMLRRQNASWKDTQFEAWAYEPGLPVICMKMRHSALFFVIA